MRDVDQIGEREIRATTAIAAQFGDAMSLRGAGSGDDDSPLARHVRTVQELAGTDHAGRREEEIRAVAKDLEDDRSTLMSDNARLLQQERSLDLQLRKLQRYDQLLGRVDNLITAQVAATHESDALLAVRQRRRDLLMHLAVATQAHETLVLITRRNADLLRVLRVAEATVLAALGNAQLDLDDRGNR